MNPLLDVMKHYGAPMTRQEYLNLAHLGKPPSTLDPESEAELPDEPRFKAFREVTHEEEAAEEAEKARAKTNSKLGLKDSKKS